MSLHTIEETIAALLEEAGSVNLGTERIPLEKLSGRILAQTVKADRPYPPFDRATMDGFACRAADGGATLQIVSTLHAGKISSVSVDQGTCVRIMTGAPVPAGADTVVRLEEAVEEAGLVRFTGEVRVGRNIARLGEDAHAGDELVKEGTACSPAVIAALATTGHPDALVHILPTIFVAATGDELIPPGTPAGAAQIRASNLYALGAHLARAGSTAETTLVRDEPAEIESAVRRGFEKDILILTGGVSKGERDYVPGLLQKLGVRTIVQGVNIKPGKPFFAGRTDRGTFVFGLPGNPFSVHVTYRVFVEPVIRKIQGAMPRPPLVLPLSGERQKKDKRAEFFPVTITSSTLTESTRTGPGHGGETGGSQAAEVRINGSGDIRAGLFSDGIALHPAENAVLPAGQMVEVHLW